MQIDMQQSLVVLIDKPLHWTSFDVVNKIRYAVIKKLRKDQPELFDGKKYKPKVGHAGTLDPLASGLLVVCIGKETKNIDHYMGLEKEYTGSFFIGATTPSFDRETETDAVYETNHITDEEIRNATASFMGEIQQYPPIFSAIKKDGKKLYHRARAGEAVKPESRNVSIREFEITGIDMPLVHFRIVCSKGTYIRSVAYDFGKVLKSGAYLNSLCRTRIGEFRLEDAVNLADFVNSMQN